MSASTATHPHYQTSKSAVFAYYRGWSLPWELGREQEREFLKIFQWLGLAFLLLALLVPYLPIPEPDPEDEVIPERLARLLLEKPKPPEPEPAPEIPLPVTPPEPQEVAVVPEVVEPTPVPEPPKQTTEQARKKASRAGLMPFMEDLAALRNSNATSAVVANQPLTGVAGESKRSERSLIAAKVGRSSGGINTAEMSRNTGGSGLGGRDTTAVGSPISGFGASGPEVRSGGGMPSRSREEIEIVFDRNKGAIYALYSRALRRDPGLQGKLVLRLTIEASGTVSMCEVVSSELGDSELERKLVQRVKMFRFDEKDVAPVTTTKPIDFFPA
jgi:protein TonB